MTTPAAVWRLSLTSARGDAGEPARIVLTAIRLVLQLLLVISLWRALYQHTPSNSGLDIHQAVSYVVLALLLSQTGGIDRGAALDSVFHHVRQGTILYWQLRPVPPRRYHAIRGAGDRLYGLGWAAGGFAVCLAIGAVAPPASAGAAAQFLVAMLAGQFVGYQLDALIDLACFWSTANQWALYIYGFVQALLSGAIVPLWFFPGWLLTATRLLPFQAVINIPVSLYVGRLSGSAAALGLLAEAAWCLALAGLTRYLWRAAGNRLVVQGG